MWGAIISVLLSLLSYSGMPSMRLSAFVHPVLCITIKAKLILFDLCNKIYKVKGSQLDAFSPQAIVYCYPEFKLSYLKNLQLFSIRVKKLSEPIVL